MTRWFLAYWHPLLFTLVGAPCWFLAGLEFFSSGGWVLCVLAPIQAVAWWARSYLRKCRLNTKITTAHS